MSEIRNMIYKDGLVSSLVAMGKGCEKCGENRFRCVDDYFEQRASHSLFILIPLVKLNFKLI